MSDVSKLREFCLRNAQGLISPANSGLIVALALFEVADAQREQTEQVRVIGNEILACLKEKMS